jgi:hypothetical protein
MAFDFPASPTTGQIFNAPTGQGYVYSGTAWNLAQTSPQAPVASDTPPANPYAGQLWLRSTTGALYMWYVDLNSSQWIQIPGTNAAPGAWELIGAVDLSGLANYDWLNLDPYRRLRLNASFVNGSAAAIVLRVSTNNGSSFASAATDYGFSTLNQQGTTVVGTASASTNGMLMTSTNADAGSNGISTVDLANFNKNLAGLYKSDTTYVAVGAIRRDLCYGNPAANTARNALRLLPSAGVFTSGHAALEGIRG